MKPSYEELEQKLAVSQREFRAADATIENLEAKCASLAAENSESEKRMQQLIQVINNADNDYCMCGDAMKNHVHGGCGHPTGMFDYHYNQWLESGNKTPATDAFLAEVQAQGVEMFAAHKRERQQALRSRSMRMSEEAAGMAADAEDFADELRKGVQS